MSDTPESFWPDTLTLTLDGMAQGGDAVGRYQGRVVFAAGGLPGEQVAVRLGQHTAAYARGTVVEVLAAAPERVAPLLPGAPHMPWQHIAYPAQLVMRRTILAEQLLKARAIEDDTIIGETLPAAAPLAYRSSARLHLAGRTIGYRDADGTTILPIERDPLLMDPLNHALAALRDALEAHPELDLPDRDVLIRLSETDGYLAAVFQGRTPSEDFATLAAAWRARCPQLADVALPGDLGLVMTEEIDEMALLLSPGTFFQVNCAVARALLGLARDGLAGTSGTLLDLFCGIGTFALPLARQFGEVIGIEESADAVALGRAAIAINRVENVALRAGKVEYLLPEIAAADAILLDPPRRGCEPAALAAIATIAPERIVYISCHPGTLARDLRTLRDAGYLARQITPVDCFPQTAHIEAVCVLTRA